MWTVVYISQMQTKAEKLIGALRKNEIISRMRNPVKKAGGICFEVLVPETEMESAQNLIFDSGLF